MKQHVENKEDSSQDMKIECELNCDFYANSKTLLNVHKELVHNIAFCKYCYEEVSSNM